MPALLAAERSLMITLNTIIAQGGFLLLASRFFAVYAIFILVGFFVLSFFIDWSFIRSSSKLLFIEGMIGLAVVWLFNQLFSLFFFRERPYVAIEKVQSFIAETVTAKSFPSDHTALSFVFATIVFMWSPKVGVWLLLLALAIGVGRVLVGVHYPTDILGGIIVGVVAGWIIHKFFV